MTGILRIIEEVVHLEGLAMFEDVFWPGPGAAPAGPEDQDVFALVEFGRSVVTWNRGAAEEARYTIAKGVFPATTAFLEEHPRANELVTERTAVKLGELEIPRSHRAWHGGILKSCSLVVFRRRVRLGDLQPGAVA